MSLDQLSYTHTVRNQQLKRWNFLYNSFMGGEKYRKGKYLHPYWGEDQAPFDAYGRRLEATPLENHVRTTVDIYRSYIWKTLPRREFNTMADNPFLESFLYDADRRGQSLDSWMKDTLGWAMSLGEMWVLVDKPSAQVDTAADEIDLDIRPYITAYTPQNILDWEYVKTVNGSRELIYVKTLEWETENEVGIREWTPTVVVEYTVARDDITGEYNHITSTMEMANNLGRVPFIRFMPMPDADYNCGVSMLGDVADLQRSIYNKLSELEQNIRISNHPVLVKTPDAHAEAGAGAIISVQEDSDPALKPYLLQPNGASIDGIIKSIERDVEAINSITHLTAIRAQKTAMSGIAMQTERQLLNAKLGDLSDAVCELEYKIWDLWSDWMDMPLEVTVTYSHNFDTRDVPMEIDNLSKAMETMNDPVFTAWAKREIVKLLVDDDDEMTELLEDLSSSTTDNTNDINNTDNPDETPSSD